VRSVICDSCPDSIEIAPVVTSLASPETMLDWRFTRRRVFKGMRSMDNDVIATHFENLDRRLGRIEQILPAVATKAELTLLATKEELQDAFAPLATRKDMELLATKEEVRDLRRHMGVLTESLRDDIHLIAAHVASERSKGSGT
jgi:hypothetical protein